MVSVVIVNSFKCGWRYRFRHVVMLCCCVGCSSSSFITGPRVVWLNTGGWVGLNLVHVYCVVACSGARLSRSSVLLSLYIAQEAGGTTDHADHMSSSPIVHLPKAK